MYGRLPTNSVNLQGRQRHDKKGWRITAATIEVMAKPDESNTQTAADQLSLWSTQKSPVINITKTT
jgi:hypothetical protein